MQSADQTFPYSYWVGSQNVPPMYQYRLVLPFEDGKVVNISTDVEFSNIDAEFKLPIDASRSAKINLSLPQDGFQLSGEVELNDDSSTTQVIVTTTGPEHTASLSHMQAITPALTLGGIGNYNSKSASISRGFAGVYNGGENTVTALWDNQVNSPLVSVVGTCFDVLARCISLSYACLDIPREVGGV